MFELTDKGSVQLTAMTALCLSDVLNKGQGQSRARVIARENAVGAVHGGSCLRHPADTEIIIAAR